MSSKDIKLSRKFLTIHPAIEKWEGGYVDHPRDPGGATNMGITLNTLSRWRGRRVTKTEVRVLSNKEARKIYKAWYFDKIRGDELPQPVALAVYNSSVLSGPSRAAKWLQQTINSHNDNIAIDGKIGPITIAAIQRLDPQALAHAYFDRYERFLRALNTWSTFGKGWQNRLNDMRKIAKNLKDPAIPTNETEKLHDQQKISGPNMRIYLFRGLFGGIFSRGMDLLAEKLAELGHTTSVHRWMEASTIQAKLLENEGHPADDLVISIIGHSLGANSANYMANDLVDAGFNIKYLATIDATGPRAAPIGPICDNFRSSDWRDKAIEGAVEYNFSDLSHTEIDKDERVHNQILSRCGAADIKTATQRFSPPPVLDAVTEKSELNDRSSTPAQQQSRNQLLDYLISMLSENMPKNDLFVQNTRELLLDEITTRPTPYLKADDQRMTPVNRWLGPQIGKLLNGKKTGIGIIGLMATIILPAIFPAASPIQDILNIITTTKETVPGGTNILVPFFAALGGWGLLGKIEKWVMYEKKRDPGFATTR